MGDIKSNLSKTFKYINALGGSIVFDYDHGYLINKPLGIDSINIDLTQAQGIDQVGSTIQSTNVQSRIVNISGKLVGDFQSSNKEKLLSIIRPDISGKLYADDFYIDVFPIMTPTIEARPKFASFNFSILAAYPYWQHDESASVVLGGMKYLFKFPWNISKPYKFAEAIETKFVNVVNRGQLPVPFTITFESKGECSNPKITNAKTGDFLLINKSMKDGERIVVEITHSRTNVVSSVDGDIRGALSLKSKLNRLAVGDNVLKPESSGGGNSLSVHIDFATEIVGVSL